MALLRTQIGRKIQDAEGNVISGATATILSLPSLSEATVYANESGTATIAQPSITGIGGDISGWLEIGDYSITIASSSGTSTSRYYANHPQQSYLETYGNDVPLTVKAGTALSSNMAEWQNPSGGTVMSVSTAGSITSPTVTAIQGSVTNTQGSVNSTQGSVNSTQGSVNSTQGSVSSHVSATTSVHGITNTANLVYTNNATLGSVSLIDTRLTAVQGTVGTNTSTLTAVQGTVTTQTTNIAALQANTGFNPPGVVLPYAGTAAPDGYLMCNGGTASRSTYAALFSAIGTAYGAGNGSSTFNVPDLRGRVPVGKGTHADVDALGDNEGITSANVANRRPKHQHTVYDPTHAHSLFANAGQSGVAYGYVDGFANSSSGPINTDFKATGVKVNPGGTASDTTSPQDSPAYLVLDYIIKT